MVRLSARNTTSVDLYGGRAIPRGTFLESVFCFLFSVLSYIVTYQLKSAFQFSVIWHRNKGHIENFYRTLFLWQATTIFCYKKRRNNSAERRTPNAERRTAITTHDAACPSRRNPSPWRGSHRERSPPRLCRSGTKPPGALRHRVVGRCAGGCRIPHGGCRIPHGGCRIPHGGCRIPHGGCSATAFRRAR